ncbi:MAG: glycogen/starch synthase, partial [Bacteroidales bacterium]|nr:glycogen/starch synthase [Bacteroidales bacterium]
MDVNKVLFISQEIAPYLPETPMATMSRDLSQAVQEKGIEVRTFMPKYGFINERRNQLHEVIRLSGMNLIIDDTDHPLIIKVATLQPAHMQVYFIFNEDYFARNITKQLETVTSPEDNDERSIFFVRGTLETVKKLRWVPSVIHCAGMISALAPLYIKDYYADDPSYRDTKVVFSIFDDDLP